jgi:hypothetical protein
MFCIGGNISICSTPIQLLLEKEMDILRNMVNASDIIYLYGIVILGIILVVGLYIWIRC